jgi:glutamine synthetase
MDLMNRVAHRHGLRVLLHEKPFAGVNGSGKHNNWSIGTNLIGTLFDPGNDAGSNQLFLLSVAALLRGLNEHPDLLRWAISGIGNDHRLGGHEAPPAIISVYLGDYIGALIESVITGKAAPPEVDAKLDLGVGHLPRRDRDNTDRNRTSPVAFTGNKFEVRGVGASQNPAHSNYILNVLMADSFGLFADEIKKKTGKGASVDAAVKELIKEQFKQHQRIINDGDGYSAQWPEEAAKRGLVNLKDTIQTLDYVNSQKSRDLLGRHGVLNDEEFTAHIIIDYANYAAAALLEGGCLRDMANKDILPAAINYQNRVHQNGSLVPQGLQKKLSALITSAYENTEKLSEACAQLSSISDEIEGARYGAKIVVPLTKELRKSLDALEDIVDRKEWPYPAYEELLLSRLAKESE